MGAATLVPRLLRVAAWSPLLASLPLASLAVLLVREM